MNSNLDDLHYFVAIVDAGTLTLAAKRLNMPKSKLSRHLAQLEEKVGSPLLLRTTRSQQLTETGELLYNQCKPHIDGLHKVEDNVSALLNEPKGQLNLLLPIEFFNQTISAIVTEFALLYPKIQLTCSHYSGIIPTSSEQYDLTFVLHEVPLPPSNSVARALLSFPQSIFAAVNYDTSHLSTVDDLKHEPCIVSHAEEQWLFRDKGRHSNKSQTVAVNARVILSSPEMRQEATQRKLGLAKLANYECQADCKMKRVILDKEPVAQQLSVLYQSRSIAFKTRLFLDFFQDNIGRLSN